MFALLDDDQIKEAAVLGKAMRLGAMLWLNADEEPGKLKWDKKSKTLTLKLNAHARPLFGEVAEQRFAALANALNADPTVTFQKKP